jgi:hypothetical protein
VHANEANESVISYDFVCFPLLERSAPAASCPCPISKTSSNLFGRHNRKCPPCQPHSTQPPSNNFLPTSTSSNPRCQASGSSQIRIPTRSSSKNPLVPPTRTTRRPRPTGQCRSPRTSRRLVPGEDIRKLDRTKNLSSGRRSRWPLQRSSRD